MAKVKRIRWTAQIPEDVNEYLITESHRNCTSKNAELIKAVRLAKEISENAKS